MKNNYKWIKYTEQLKKKSTKNQYLQKWIENHVPDYKRINENVRGGKKNLPFYNIETDDTDLENFCNNYFINISEEMINNINPPRDSFKMVYSTIGNRFILCILLRSQHA